MREDKGKNTGSFLFLEQAYEKGDTERKHGIRLEHRVRFSRKKVPTSSP